MPWMKGQTNPMMNAATTGPRKSRPQCWSDRSRELLADIFLLALILNSLG